MTAMLDIATTEQQFRDHCGRIGEDADALISAAAQHVRVGGEFPQPRELTHEEIRMIVEDEMRAEF